MSTTVITGFEMGNSNELAVGGLPFSSSVVRSGSFSLHVTGGASQALKQRQAGGTFLNFVQSLRVYFQLASLPASDDSALKAGVSGGGGGFTGWELDIEPSGTITFVSGSTGTPVTSSLVLTVDSLWHRFDVDVNSAAGTATVYVDGVSWVTTSGNGTQAVQATLQFGGAFLSMYFDDLLCDDASIGAPAPGANNSVLLLTPTAGNSANSWTDGAGGTGDIHNSVDNIPPIGSASATANAKIKNAASGTTLDYTATMQTYTAAGVPAGSTVNAVMAICNDGEEVGTGTKSGSVWIASNPVQTAPASNQFDYGDDAGALGTFPTGWATHYGSVSSAPTITLGTAPAVTVRKGTATTRVVDVDFLGLYIDYTPPSTPFVSPIYPDLIPDRRGVVGY